MDTNTLEKLRSLVLHDGTPHEERKSALGKLEALVSKTASLKMRVPVTRSARIGKLRKGVYVNELDRIEIFAFDLSFGQILLHLSRILAALSAQPTRFDFGWDNNRGPVVSIGFLPADAPALVEFQEAARGIFPEAVATKAGRHPEGELKFLLFFGSKEPRS